MATRYWKLLAGIHGDSTTNYNPGDIVTTTTDDANDETPADLSTLMNGNTPRFVEVDANGNPV